MASRLNTNLRFVFEFIESIFILSNSEMISLYETTTTTIIRFANGLVTKHDWLLRSKKVWSNIFEWKPYSMESGALLVNIVAIHSPSGPVAEALTTHRHRLTSIRMMTMPISRTVMVWNPCALWECKGMHCEDTLTLSLSISSSNRSTNTIWCPDHLVQVQIDSLDSSICKANFSGFNRENWNAFTNILSVDVAISPLRRHRRTWQLRCRMIPLFDRMWIGTRTETQQKMNRM